MTADFQDVYKRQVDNLTLSLANAEGVTDEAQEEGLVRDGVLAQTSTTYSVETEIQACLLYTSRCV